MKLYVGGNCLGETIADLCALNRDVVVERVPWTTGAPPCERDDGVVIWQIGEGRERPVNAPVNVVFWCDLTFRPFHPDQAYVQTAAGAIPSPIGHYHSMLVFQAWLRGMSPARARQLFSAESFAAAGYFIDWNAARAGFLERAARAGADLTSAFVRWTRSGCFMHSTNHPKAVMIADVARDVLVRAGAPAFADGADRLVPDRLLAYDTWPVYPPIADRLGLGGDYVFKARIAAGARAPQLFDLDGFIAGSYAAYAQHAPETLVCHQASTIDWRFLDELAPSSKQTVSPYAALPDERFWRRAVSVPAAADVDPAGDLVLPIGRETVIASAGSCFAQHVSRALACSGYDYLVTERAPAGMQADEAHGLQYGVYSARFGNVYTARALLQLVERAYGDRVPSDAAWQRADGRWVDPFRPQVEPAGFADAAAVECAREPHHAAVRAMLEQLDVFVFTLGQTEEWYARADGSVFPLAPGVTGCPHDPRAYEFRNARHADVVGDLDAFLARLRVINPRASVVLTVSPVAPIATYVPRHVLVSAAVTKAVLRAAVDDVERAHDNVWYFPSYEIVTAAPSRGSYLADDLRTVTQAGVDHVMRLFFAHCSGGEVSQPRARPAPSEHVESPDMAVICDEELLAPMHSSSLRTPT